RVTQAKELVQQARMALEEETGDPKKLETQRDKCNEALRLVPGFEPAKDLRDRIDLIATQMKSDECRRALGLYREADEIFEDPQSPLFDSSQQGLSAARQKVGQSIRLCSVLAEAPILLKRLTNYPTIQTR